MDNVQKTPCRHPEKCGVTFHMTDAARARCAQYDNETGNSSPDADLLSPQLAPVLNKPSGPDSELAEPPHYNEGSVTQTLIDGGVEISDDADIDEQYDVEAIASVLNRRSGPYTVEQAEEEFWNAAEYFARNTDPVDPRQLQEELDNYGSEYSASNINRHSNAFKNYYIDAEKQILADGGDDNPFLEPEIYIEEADDKANRYLSRRREVEIDKACSQPDGDMTVIHDHERDGSPDDGVDWIAVDDPTTSDHRKTRFVSVHSSKDMRMENHYVVESWSYVPEYDEEEENFTDPTFMKQYYDGIPVEESPDPDWPGHIKRDRVEPAYTAPGDLRRTMDHVLGR